MAKIQEGKLPKAFKTKWIKALKSDKYLKGSGTLCRDNSNADQGFTWCCLGVAADICGMKNLGNFDFIQIGKKMKGISKVPKILKGTAGTAETLANINDKSTSFNPVIEYIEKNL